MLSEKYYDEILQLLGKIRVKQKENVMRAAELIAESITNGGILQAYGSGHSYGTALEICGRAGGLIPSKQIIEPSGGIYERIEGVGEAFIKMTDLRKEDILIIISNSGRNPLGIEIAKGAKEKGIKVIIVTCYEVSKKLTSRHSSGKMLFDYADVILDNMGVEGDSCLEVPGLPVKIAGTSSIAGAMLLNSAVIEAIEIMVNKGFIPPVFMSANVDGGKEFNEKLLSKYKDRLTRR
ncbi:SIS domain-containing protein [Clostridium sp. LP20]|uniref:SIS domain-containing protein n=1 Tax=Clostridium sp. LP20 TaxID=3418665 RepID=UPI003EE45149